MTGSYYVFGKNRNDFGWTACMSTKKRFLTQDFPSSCNGNPLGFLKFSRSLQYEVNGRIANSHGRKWGCKERNVEEEENVDKFKGREKEGMRIKGEKRE